MKFDNYDRGKYFWSVNHAMLVRLWIYNNNNNINNNSDKKVYMMTTKYFVENFLNIGHSTDLCRACWSHSAFLFLHRQDSASRCLYFSLYKNIMTHILVFCTIIKLCAIQKHTNKGRKRRTSDGNDGNRYKNCKSSKTVVPYTVSSVENLVC